MATGPPQNRKPTRRRQVASDYDDPFRAPTKSENIEFKRRARTQDKEISDIYEAGRKEGQGESRKSGGSSGGKTPPRKTPARKRRPVPGALSARAAARQLQAPVRAQLTTGLYLAGLALAIVALYDVLASPATPGGFSGAQAFTQGLGGLSRALRWLSLPLPMPDRR